MRRDTKGIMAAILTAGEKEFLELGYEGATLRGIASTAGLTTGAIYVRFSSKERLFQALTKEAADGMLDLYQHRFSGLYHYDRERGLLIEELVSDESILKLIQYVYNHFTSFKLLLCQGMRGYNESFFRKLDAIRENVLSSLIADLKTDRCPCLDIDVELIHILENSLIQQINQFVARDISRENAIAYAKELGVFWRSGYKALREH